MKNCIIQGRFFGKTVALQHPHNDNLRYFKITYVSETLRKYPPQAYLSRVANTQVKLPGTNYEVRKGHPVFIPLVGIHYDPDIYPDPDRFNPDRMTREKMQARHPCSFMPFGYGKDCYN